MDRALLEKKQRKKIKALKKKLKNQESELKRNTPEKPKEDLEDVVANELNTKVNIKKAPLPPPIELKEEEEEIEVLENHSEQDEDDEEEVQADVVTSGEILDVAKEAVQEEKNKKKNKRVSGGEFGAAYSELYNQLCMRMLNRIYRYFQKLYKRSSSEKDFQKRLAAIQTWNQLEINRRAKEIVQAYPDTESYFRYAYAGNVMLMSVVVQKDENSEDIEIEVPKFSDFILKSYIESARAIYDNVGVLNPDLPDRDRLAIRQELLRCYGNAIATALRMMVPLEAIAPHLNNKSENYDDVGDSSEGEEESEDESEEDSEEEDSDEDDSEEEDSNEDDSDEYDSEESDEEEEESEKDDSEEEEEEESEEEDNTKPRKSKKIGISKKTLREQDEHPFY